MIGETCPALDKIRSPAGDCITLRAYEEYVCRMLREELTMAEVGALLKHFHCRIEELVEKIIQTKMVGFWLTVKGRVR